NGTACDDVSVSLALRAMAREDELRDRIDLVLREPRSRAAHRFHDGLASDLRRARNQRDFRGTLDRAHLVKNRRQILLFERRRARLQQLAWMPLTANAGVPGIGCHILRPSESAVPTLARAF